MIRYVGRLRVTILMVSVLSTIHLGVVPEAHGGPLLDRLTHCGKTEGLRMLQEQPFRLLAARLDVSEILGIIGTAYVSAKSATNHGSRQLANQAIIDGIKLYIQREHPRLARLVDFGRFGLCVLGHRRRTSSTIRPARSTPRKTMPSQRGDIRVARSAIGPRPKQLPSTLRKHRTQQSPPKTRGAKGIGSTMPTSGYWVQFGAYRSQARAHQLVSKLGQHRQRFSKQEIRLVAIQTKSQKQATRILVGPFEDKPKARQLCTEMKVLNFKCFASSSRRR
jgi:cell division septation protein DedD